MTEGMDGMGLSRKRGLAEVGDMYKVQCEYSVVIGGSSQG